MDALTESLATSFSVSSDPNSTAAPHPRFAEYKRKVSNADQESRRRQILEQQKSRRFDYANLARRIFDDVWEDADDLGSEEEEMDATDTPGKKSYRPGRYYKNQLMLSEWLVEVPADFEEDWLMVACPWGKRCLIVSARGTTTAYGRNGYRLNSFPSHLPGGNRKQSGCYKDDAILDCIFDEVQKTFYVLDVMNWKGHPVYDSETSLRSASTDPKKSVMGKIAPKTRCACVGAQCDFLRDMETKSFQFPGAGTALGGTPTDFRFFWMVSKMQEIPEAGEASKINPHKFVPLQYHQCKAAVLKQVFDTTQEQFDGCLFYHKRAHYIFGTSPLVVWLKPYMIPEMLGIQVPERMMQQKPANYSTYQSHLENVKLTKERIAEERKQKGQEKKGKRGPDRSAKFKMEPGSITVPVVYPNNVWTLLGVRPDPASLSQSKWYTEMPEGFETDWVTIVCPVGQRCQVMAIDGETKCFSKKCFKLPGYFLSLLPGGNGHEYGFGPTVVTLLDCVYCEERKTYFILDCILWSGSNLRGLPFSERTRVMRTEILKRPEFKEISDINMAKFVPLYHYESSLVGLDQALRQTTFEIDGILFYKKDSPYVSGETDKVLWTKPYMLPDIFEGIAVPKVFMEQKPESYKDFTTFVDDVKHGRVKEKKRKKKSKEFVPNVELNLPPQAPEIANMTEKIKKRGCSQVKHKIPWSYYGPEEGFKFIGKDGKEFIPKHRRGRGGSGAGLPGGRGRGFGRDYRGGGQGQMGHSYGRVLAMGGGDGSYYGEGSLTGCPYFGDELDVYHPRQGGNHQERAIRGKRARNRQANSFGLTDLEAALPHYEVSRSNRGKKGY